MHAVSRKAHLTGTADVPASKSHTVRSLILGALAEGTSEIHAPLDSFDTRSCCEAVRAFGAKVETVGDPWLVNGVAGKPAIPDNVVDVGNSGTTLYMTMGAAALVDGWTVLTGDGQIRRRTAAPLVSALEGLGVTVFSSRGDGCAPLLVRGPLMGGETTVRGVSSQYVSSLLMACPLAPHDSVITVTELNERPYVEMTLSWLDYLGVRPEHDPGLSRFRIAGNARYPSFSRRIPGDFSSATFLLCAGAIAGGALVLRGLSMDDPQGDKAIVDILRAMGADIQVGGDEIVVSGGRLRGIDIDMNAIPDAIPMLAVTACFADGTTTLRNVPQARLKETDRIAVMAAELAKLGADVRELPDGLIINGTGLNGGKVHGHGDHRIVMAFTVAGCAAKGPITVDTAEAAGVTYPAFWNTMERLGADITRFE